MRLSCTFWLLLAVYAALMTCVIWGLFQTRGWAVATYSTPAEERNWREFRESLNQRQTSSPSNAESPSQRGNEPPIKILFAENFWQVLLWSILFLSILYWSVGIMLIGALRTPNQVPARRSPDTDV